LWRFGTTPATGRGLDDDAGLGNRPATDRRDRRLPNPPVDLTDEVGTDESRRKGTATGSNAPIRSEEERTHRRERTPAEGTTAEGTTAEGTTAEGTTAERVPIDKAFVARLQLLRLHHLDGFVAPGCPEEAGDGLAPGERERRAPVST